jgi:N-acetylated-alpha-linked acidic dipeptidase
VWPDGPWKPAHEAQRGSISPIGRTPGDPSTPGWASPRPGADGRRLAGAELAAALPAIPCLPIGADDARAILAGLAPRAFVGADGAVAERPVGPGPREARISVDSPRELRTIHDVIATLPGASDEFVLGGAHRDAWVRGAVDNGTGCVVLLRAAQILGQRARAGWRPPRTLKLAFWDAEEFGLIGSTEWAEEHAELLRARCTAYVNSDVAVTGTRFGGASGTPGMLGALEPVLRRVAGTAQTSLWDEWIAKTPAPRLGLPGSGSDFAVFVHHLNVPYVEVGLSGAGGGGFYHTAFDGVELLERFVDPGYVGHELAARLHAELFLELLERGRDAFDGAEAARRLADEAAKLGESVPALADVATELAVAFRATAAALEREPRAGRDLLRELEVAAGLPGRPWHRNALWSPGLEDGYGSETFPALRAAAQDHQAARAAAAPILAGLARLRARAGDP